MGGRDRARRLRRLEEGGGVPTGGDDPRRGIPLLITFIGDRRQPDGLDDRRLLLSIGLGVLGGLHAAKIEHVAPRSATSAALLRAYGLGRPEYMYLDECPEPEAPPPTPPLWRRLEHDLAVIRDALPPPPPLPASVARFA